MVATGQTKEIFDDARAMHAAALDRLDAGDIRDAAEKAGAPRGGPPRP